MLLIVVSQNLIDAYEAIVKLLTQQFNEIHKGSFHMESVSHHRTNISRLSPGHQESSSIPPSHQPLDLQGYDFEDFEEPCVFGGIVHLQLTFLQSLLNRVRHILCSWNLDAHLARVETVNERIKELSALFVMNEEEMFDR